MSFTIGSLFDGSGGFPLAGFLCGGVPVWASEIEPYPIAVTKSRFPHMKHLGSVTDIKGDEIEPVDVITFGSPCQDLSVAGKRAGLKHEDNGDDETTRSGLFMEAVRIIKEMREKTNGEYPRFALWENVPGAFSSNKGEDFKVVLEELIKIVEPTAVMPDVPKKGWAYADCYRGDGWSIAYRVLDAQYWGVPQRRRRIYLVADFRGERAGEILFKRNGLRGYSSQSRSPWETAPGDIEIGVGTADCENGCIAYSFDALSSNSMKSNNPHSGCRQVDVSKCLDTTDPNPSKNQGGIAVLEPIAYSVQDRAGKPGGGKGMLVQENRATSLRTNNYQYIFQPIAVATQQGGAEISENGVCPTVTAAAGMSGNNQPWVVYESHPMDSRIKELDDVSPTVSQKWHKGAADTPLVCQQYLFENHSQDSRYKGPLDVCPMLPAQLGTGGNNQPFVVEQVPFCKGARPRSADDATVWKEAKVSNTLNTFDLGEVRCNELVVYCLQGNGIDRADTAGCNGKGWKEDTCYTLNTIDRPAVAYLASGKDTTGTLMASMATKQCLGDQEAFSGDYHIIEENPIALDESTAAYQTTVGSLCARDYKGVGNQYVSEDKLIVDPTTTQYIVRRLTPTECARLQGFIDEWGHPDHKDDFTDEEYSFWLNVRNTHAEINGKQVKDYTKKQMLTWYNKLHTDSAEYKMWGNGIALPTALYVMEGIADVYTSV